MTTAWYNYPNEEPQTVPLEAIEPQDCLNPDCDNVATEQSELCLRCELDPEIAP